MARWNNERRVLNHEHTRFWRYTLQDIPEPNLQRDVFPYDEVCRIDFNRKIISISPAKELLITDTTFKITGQLCLTVSGPIRDKEDQIVGVCGLDIKFEDLSKTEGEKES